MAALLKKPRVSKNKKKNWNKYCDVNEVEEYLEEKRFEERIGGSVSALPDNELFFLDTTIKPEGKRSVRKVKQKELRCHQILNSYSKVVPPGVSKAGITKKHKTRLSKLEQKKLKHLLIDEKFKAFAKPPPKKAYDLWAEDKKEVNPEIKELIEYGEEIMRKKPIKVPEHFYQKPSLLPAVEVPHPGSSYNPAYEDHQDLLREAVTIEQKKLKQELHLKRVLLDMFPSKKDAPTQKTWLEEMSQGLDEAEDDDDVDLNNNGSNVLTINPVVTTDGQKSKAMRKKERAQRQLARQKLLEKKTKKEVHEVYRLRSILADIKAKERAAEATCQKTAEKKIARMYQPHVLGQHKYEPNDLEVNLSEELQGSLREFKMEGNVMEDRYKSFQRRNIIEPRIKQVKKRKYKLKKQIKRSHRDVEIVKK